MSSCKHSFQEERNTECFRVWKANFDVRESSGGWFDPNKPPLCTKAALRGQRLRISVESKHQGDVFRF